MFQRTYRGSQPNHLPTALKLRSRRSISERIDTVLKSLNTNYILLCLGLIQIEAADLSAAVVVTLEPGTQQWASSLDAFGTDGADMAGIEVTAFFAGGSSETVTWAATGATSGGVTGSMFSLSLDGDSHGYYDNSWILSNLDPSLAMTGLVINAGVGGNTFDVALDNNGVFVPSGGGVNSSYSEGTPDSNYGWTFEVTSNPTNVDIDATYINTLGIGAANPVGDLYTVLDLQFTNLGGLSAGSQLQFIADTDNALGMINAVPEPSAMILLGICGLFPVLRSRRRSGQANASVAT